MIKKIRMQFLKMSYSLTLIVTLVLYLLAGHLAALDVIAIDYNCGAMDVAKALFGPEVIVLGAAAVFVSELVHMEYRDNTIKSFVSAAQDKGDLAAVKFWTLAIYSLFLTIAETAVLVIESLIRANVVFTMKELGFAGLIVLFVYILNLCAYGIMELIALLIRSDAMSVFVSLIICWGAPYVFTKLTDMDLVPAGLKETGIYAAVALIALIIVEMISTAVVRSREV
ncbi:MAG: hypothetical protein PUB39_06300 [Eubacteriales bacterium]|nr:hypothetical protein [Eubacteriales bacterium]